MKLAYFCLIFIILVFRPAASQINTGGNTGTGGIIGPLPPFPNGDTCTQFNYKRDINFKKLQGAWYAQFLSDNGTQYGCDGDCWTMFFAETAPQNLDVDICCQQCKQPLCGTILGSGSVTGTSNNPGYLNYYFSSYVPTFILDTDYKTFVIWIDCYPDPPTNYSYVKPVITILSRQPHVGPEFKKMTFDILKANKFDPSTIVKIKHNKHCNYIFDPPK